jgi:hypothetical protein
MKKYSVILSLFVVAILFAACGEETTEQSFNQTTTTKEQQESKPRPTTTTRPPTTTTTQDTSWAFAASDVADEMVSYMEEIEYAANNEDYYGLVSACEEAWYETDAWLEEAESIPVPSIRDPFVAAIEAYDTAFYYCSEGELETSLPYMEEGMSFMEQATAAVKDAMN